MSADAVRNLDEKVIDSFLGNGCFIELGLQKCLVAWGNPKRLKKPNIEKPQFYLPDFYLEDKSPWVSFEHVAVTHTIALADALQSFSEQPKLDLIFQEPDFAQFENVFGKIKSSIQNSEIKKAVPVVFAKANGSITKAMRAQYIQNLLRRQNKQTPYGYLTPTSGLLGATPEILFSYDNKNLRLETMALAGTRRSDQEKVNSLSEDEKEMYEHQLVVQGLKEKLKELGDLEISPTYVWDLGMISHLRTDISIELSGQPISSALFVEMCERLHPTAALGVAPQSADWRYLKSCEGTLDRARFGAPFGVLNPMGKSLALVAIADQLLFE